MSKVRVTGSHNTQTSRRANALQTGAVIGVRIRAWAIIFFLKQICVIRLIHGDRISWPQGDLCRYRCSKQTATLPWWRKCCAMLALRAYRCKLQRIGLSNNWPLSIIGEIDLIEMARYGLFVLKVPLNPNQPTNRSDWEKHKAWCSAPHGTMA